MKFDKIDKYLLNKVNVLSSDENLYAFIFSNHVERLKKILNFNKIQIINEYSFINALFCKLKKGDILGLSDYQEIDYISSVMNVNALMYISKKILGTEELFSSGRNINIAFIDTGITPHCDFSLGENRIKFFKDFVNDKSQPYDDNGHGTFVCGVCSGNGNLSALKYSGIAPCSNIFALKALNNKGEASANQILDAMQWVYDNHKKYDIKIVCMSFGSEPIGHNDPIMIGAETLWKEGVVIVAAAGNSGPEYQTIKSPGVSSKIITVGGFDDKRKSNKYFNEEDFDVAKFSSRGPAYQRFKPDIIAPSVDIISCGKDKDYITLSGTSVATPMVAGLVALIYEKYKDITPDEIKRILLSSCKPIVNNKNFEGFGYPQINRYLNI